MSIYELQKDINTKEKLHVQVVMGSIGEGVCKRSYSRVASVKTWRWENA
jgi:hypothetical protein